MSSSTHILSPPARAFYRDALVRLNEAAVPFLVGGAFALSRYTGIKRHTKDVDLFVRRQDLERTLQALAEPGWSAEMTASHWLAKVRCGDLAIDLIFASGNGVSQVDEGWFARALDDDVLGLPVKLCSAEDILWTKAFIQERERFDGADVTHLVLRADLDWHLLLEHFGNHWHVLLAHVVLFGFTYPSERDRVPRWVMENLLQRFQEEVARPTPSLRICNGTLLSRAQYLVAVQEWDFADGRLAPGAEITPEQIRSWTEAIDADHVPNGDPSDDPSS